MRVTNGMIMSNAATNINATKVSVDKTNTQMTSQKKISRPSEDPVVAIRSLRLQTSLNKVNQYYEKNIPDAESWMDVTETALVNMKSLVTDMRTQCVSGSTGTLTSDDRNTILSQLKALQEQIYSEGNADYAGRTVFTGFRTNQNLTFLKDESDTKYNISQKLDATAMDTNTYFTGSVQVPSTETEVLNNPISDIDSDTYNRLRLSYDNLGNMDKYAYSITKTTGGVTTTNNYSMTPAAATFTDTDGNTRNYATASTTDENGNTENVYTFENEADWEAWSKTQTDAGGNPVNSKYVAANDTVIIRETGEMLFGSDRSASMKSSKASIDINYDKTGFKSGELRPEYYYNCTDNTDAANPINYEKYNAAGQQLSYGINYTVAANQTMSVNLEASDVFDSSILQDINDMIGAVNGSISAHDKVDKITAMMKEDQYAGAADQKKLQKWLDAANKEMDCTDKHLSTLYSNTLGNVDGYLEKINLNTTKLGCKADQLSITKKRMSEQQETVKELQSENDNLDLSDIVIKYTAAYTAYTSSLQAAGKLGSQTLLNYI